MKTAIQILRGILTVILLGVIAINAWLLADEMIFKHNPPSLLGYSRLVVASGSMEPTFSTGDVIFIHRQDSYELNDVVTFRDSSGNLVTHRLVGTSGGEFITRGDANNIEDDELLNPAQILGRYTLRIPGLGGLVEFLRSPLGLCLLVIVGFFIIELPVLFGREPKAGGKHSGG